MFGVVLVAVLGASACLQHPHGEVSAPTGILNTLSVYYTESGITVERVLLTQARVLFTYLSLMLAPFPSRVQLISPQVLARSLFDDPITLLSVSGAIALVAVGGILIRRSTLSGVGILFIVVNLVLEPLLAPQYSFFAYRAVLPLFGMLLIIADCVRILLASIPHPRLKRFVSVGLCAVAVGMAVLMGCATNHKARVWGNRVGFWQETVTQFPPLSERMETRSAAQAYANLGWALCVEHRYSDALPILERARDLSPGHASIVATLAYVRAKTGHPKEAEQLFEQAISLNPDSAFAHKELGFLLLSRNRGEEALAHLQRALKLAPYEESVRRTLERLSALPSR